VIFYTFLIVAYDLKTGNGRYTIEPISGYCNYFGTKFYHTWNIRYMSLVIHKVAQVIILITYLYYLNKCRNKKYNKCLLLIAITMGANIGISPFLMLFAKIVLKTDPNLSIIMGSTLQLIQESVIMLSFMCTPKMKRLCKEYYLRN